MRERQKHRAEVLATRPWAATSFQVPEHLKRVPTMLTSEECRMIVWISLHLYSYKGMICELGPFMGGSSPSAQGLAAKNSHISNQRGWR